MKSVLVISFSNLASDPRVNRQIRLLSTRYRVMAAGMANPQIAGIEYVPLNRSPKSLAEKIWVGVNLKLGRYESCYWSDKHVQQAVSILKRVPVDAIVANDVETLPLALAIANGKPVVLDAHEYSPREYEDSWPWRFFLQQYKEYLCRQYLPACSGMLIKPVEGLGPDGLAVDEVAVVGVLGVPLAEPLLHLRHQ